MVWTCRNDSKPKRSNKSKRTKIRKSGGRPLPTRNVKRASEKLNDRMIWMIQSQSTTSCRPACCHKPLPHASIRVHAPARATEPPWPPAPTTFPAWAWACAPLMQKWSTFQPWRGCQAWSRIALLLQLLGNPCEIVKPYAVTNSSEQVLWKGWDKRMWNHPTWFPQASGLHFAIFQGTVGICHTAGRRQSAFLAASQGQTHVVACCGRSGLMRPIQPEKPSKKWPMARDPAYTEA